MAATGMSQIKLSTESLDELIVFSNKYRQEVSNSADEIMKICRQMEENEALKGGDGDQIRENFATIAVACKGLNESTTYISKILNDRLKKAIDMTKNRTGASSEEAIKKASSKTGVFKK